MSDKAEPPSDDTPQLSRIVRHVQPLGPRVLVRISADSDRLESGLYVPQGAKDDQAEALLGEVVEVARASTGANAKSFEELAHDEDNDDEEARHEFGANVSGVPLGAKVLFGKDKGTKVPWDDTMRIIEVRHILAIVDEISEDEMQ